MGATSPIEHSPNSPAEKQVEIESTEFGAAGKKQAFEIGECGWMSATGNVAVVGGINRAWLCHLGNRERFCYREAGGFDIRGVIRLT